MCDAGECFVTLPIVIVYHRVAGNHGQPHRIAGARTAAVRYVSVSAGDIRAHISKAQSLGGKMVIPPVNIPGGTFAWIADPGGNIMALFKPDHEQSADAERAPHLILHLPALRYNQIPRL